MPNGLHSINKAKLARLHPLSTMGFTQGEFDDPPWNVEPWMNHGM